MKRIGYSILGACLLLMPIFAQQRGLTVEVKPAEILEKTPGVGERYALLIGITKYANPTINLNFAAADAEALQKLLLDPEIGAYKPDNVRMLIDDQANRKNILSSLNTWLGARIKPEDSVLIFYSGHGALGNNNSAYWVTYDADVEDLSSSALSNQDISTFIANLPARRKLTLIDSCFSEATAKKYRALVPSEVFNDFKGEGVVTMTASTGQEKSVEIGGHGAFTFHLLDALQGKADANGNGVVELDEVWSYLSERVQKTAADAGNRQTPVLLADRMEHGFPLTINPARAAGATLAELKNMYSASTISIDEVSEAERLFIQRGGSPELRKLYRDLAAGVLTPEYFRQFRQLQLANTGTPAAAAGAAAPTLRQPDAEQEAQRKAELAAFEIAKASESEGAWNQFLSKYPNSGFADEARRRVAEVKEAAQKQKAESTSYILAQSQNSEQAWENFIKQYPASQLAVIGQTNLDTLRKTNRERENSLYAKAMQTNIPADWDQLLKEFPSGRFVEESVRRRTEAVRKIEEETTYKAVLSSNTVESWKTYLDKYPTGTNAAEAKTCVDQLTWLGVADVKMHPAGSFTRGSAKGEGDEKPPHRVELDAFSIGRSEVTNALYQKFLDETKRPRPRDPDFAKNYMTSGPDLPVVNVTYADAMAFCKWLGEKVGALVRLPTEPEWEYAALAGHDGATYPWGSGDPKTRARFSSNRGSGVRTVARDAFSANDFGLHNMAGNVAEWVADFYSDKAYEGGTKKNPTGPTSGKERVIRGGSFESSEQDIQVFRRDKADPNKPEPFIGFRIVVK